MDLVWIAPAGVGVVAGVAVTVSSLRVARAADELRVSLLRLRELRAGGRSLRDQVDALGATLEELGRR